MFLHKARLILVCFGILFQIEDMLLLLDVYAVINKHNVSIKIVSVATGQDQVMHSLDCETPSKRSVQLLVG